MLDTPFYDPTKSYEENFDRGPFGAFANGLTFTRAGEPSTQFLRQPVYLPFGIPAGPLINAKFCAAAFAKGFDLIVYKTVRTSAHPCHPMPNIVALNVEGDLTPDKTAQPLIAKVSFGEPLTITNSFGVPSKAVDFWQADMAQAIKAAGKGQVLIGSCQGTNRPGGSSEAFIADYALAARLVKETGAPIIEINLSCPNEGSSNLVCFDIDRVERIVHAVKNEIGETPLVLKLAHFEQESALSLLVKRVGSLAQGFAAINTIPARIIDEKGNQALPGNNRLVSGTCGAGIKWAGLAMTKRLAHLREELGLQYVIIGVGGVMQPENYFEYRKLGADAVMSATGAMWRPTLAQEIWQLHEEKGAL